MIKSKQPRLKTDMSLLELALIGCLASICVFGAIDLVSML